MKISLFSNDGSFLLLFKCMRKTVMSCKRLQKWEVFMIYSEVKTNAILYISVVFYKLNLLAFRIFKGFPTVRYILLI